MKRSLLLILALIMAFSVCAHAESGVVPLNDRLFKDAKESLLLFEAGDHAAAAELLGFGTAEEFEKFIRGNFTTFGTEPVQTKVAVAWWNGSAWTMAVPLHEPSSPDVEVLVLVTNNIDCSAFCGYRYAEWSEIETELAGCDYVVWNEEYIEDASMVIYMDD